MSKVKERNQKFGKMTKAQKRVAIAKDVIKHLDAKKISATHGTYLSRPGMKTFDIDDYNYEDGRQLGEVLSQHKCNVCAVGGLMYGALTRFDKYSVGQASAEGCAISCGVDVSETGYLSRFFAPKQIRLMEAAFEGGNGVTNESEFPGDVAKHIKSFHRAGRSAGGRLRAICKNIIDNGGTFVLPEAA